MYKIVCILYLLPTFRKHIIWHIDQQMEVSRPGLVSRPVWWSPSQAWKSWSRFRTLKVSVLLKATCQDHRDLKNSDIKNNYWNSILKTAKWWSTKKFPCAVIVIDKVCHYLFEYIMQVLCTSELYGFLGIWVTSIVMNRRPVQVHCVLCVLDEIWGLGLGLDLRLLRSRSLSRMVRSRILRSRLHHWYWPTP